MVFADIQWLLFSSERIPAQGLLFRVRKFMLEFACSSYFFIKYLMEMFHMLRDVTAKVPNIANIRIIVYFIILLSFYDKLLK